MTSRKRNSPGIEINEIDRSQYNNKPDYSTVGTTTFMCGFADKGNDYITEWINSIKTLNNTFGEPTTEVERYFYNGAIEILNKGGVLLMSKLPYDNLSKDKFAQVSYKVNTDFNSISSSSSTSAEYDFYKRQMMSADSSLTSYIYIEDLSNTLDSKHNELIDLSTFDGYKTHEVVIPTNTFKIVDISRKRYDKINMISSYTIESIEETEKFTNVEELFIGIMPVVVSPINAMYFLLIIKDNTSVYVNVETTENTSTNGKNLGEEYSDNISAFNVIDNASNRDDVELSTYMQKSTYNNNFELLLSANSINDSSVSKIAASYFPNINYQTENFLNRKYLKLIGIVVFQLFKDDANDKKLNFSPVEAFVGSLDRNEKDKTSNASIFIDDVVNNSSNYINLFSNIRINDNYKNASTILLRRQHAKILGFKYSECAKNIDYVNSIINPLTRIFDANQDPNLVNIDIVCDAGVSNIAQHVKSFGSYSSEKQLTNPIDTYNSEVYPDVWNANSTSTTNLWKITDGNAAWKAVLTKYDNFCKNIRKDCIFLTDVLRPFCLQGNQKIVRTTNLANTIENSIIPNLNYVLALNSSYSAGYCDWFYVQDYNTTDFMWLPPSIKAAGVCNYIDTYFHSWDAPAGVTRGHLDNVYDVAFSPRNDEAGKIYQHAWNYAINYPIDGIVIEGQKTFQLEQTALDRINVRRLMLYLEKSVKNIARKFLYEGNTTYIRLKFVDTIKPIFENAKNSYGINDYAIRCDDTNNTTTTIENNELRCAIAVKPVKTIEWIICDFIVTNQSTNVAEEVMKN